VQVRICSSVTLLGIPTVAEVLIKISVHLHLLRWVRSRNVYRPRTGGDRRDRWRMLMKRLLLYTTTGCGGSKRLATSNPPSYRVIFLLNTNPNCSVTSVLFERRALLFRSHARDTVYACSRI
jgi:hypothetical protein